MLRYENRWHDAANGPLDGEARLLWLSRVPSGAGSLVPPADDDESDDLPPEDGATPEAGAEAGRRVRSTITAGQQFVRRKARQTLEVSPEQQQVPKADDLLMNAGTLEEELRTQHAQLEEMHATATARKNAGKKTGDATPDAIEARKSVYETSIRHLTDRRMALELSELKKWERGDLTPGEFLAKLREFYANLKTIDDADTTMTPSTRRQREWDRAHFLEQARLEVENVRNTLPAAMPLYPTQQQTTPPPTERDVWKLYDNTEKSDIIQRVSAAAGLNDVKIALDNEIRETSESLEGEKVRKLELALLAAIDEDRQSEAVPDLEGGGFPNPITSVTAFVHAANQKLGIEWLTLYEWKAAFEEVIESIKEVRKRNSIGRVSRAALMIGEAASLIPGTGGQDLVNVLDEQVQKKNDEIRDDYKKELGHPRTDYGFKELFGDGQGKEGALRYYMRLHDTNRTRAIIEFAAGKGLLYGIDKAENAHKYMLPGGIPFRDALPPEWTEQQVESYLNNMYFENNQGIEKQTKAGEALVSGRATVEGYTDPFRGSVNGLSLWFAKGIVNKALTKVKNGEMSSLLTLIVLDAWENNPLFRKYVPAEWMDRLAGDSKQLMIGMIKYDQAHLLSGAQGEEYSKVPGTKITRHLELARHPERGKPRLGPLVVAIRDYLKKKDPSLEGDDPDTIKKLALLTAKVLASQTVELKNGQRASIYVPELAKYRIAYQPNEMRGANVHALGDDNFIERSEIINGTVEVMKAVGQVSQDGFREQEKARYYFSHIIDNYKELNETFPRKFESQGRAAEAAEMRAAAQEFMKRLNPQLNEWVKEALVGTGGKKVLNVQHAKQDGRYLILTLVKEGLISRSVIEQMAQQEKNPNAAKLLRDLDRGARGAT